MTTYQATYCRIEHRIETLECEANSEEEASEKFDEMISDSELIDFDAMECVHADDFIQDIEELG